MRPDEIARGGPVTAPERILCLDMLRGVAVLGILVMNIYAFAMPFSAYGNPLLMGGTELHNIGTWFLTHVFFDQKFISIFSMMFGAGIVLMSERAEAKSLRPAAFFYRRQFWLLVIGAAHACLLWMGDILFTYALIGMLAFLFRKCTAKTLIVVACCLMPVAPLINYGMSVHMEQIRDEAAGLATLKSAGQELSEEQQKRIDEWEDMRAFVAPTPADTQRDLDIHRGTYLDIVRHRVPEVASMQVFVVIFYGLWRVGALMLVGMALMKTGVLTGERSTSFYRRLAALGYAAGVPLAAFSAWDLYQHDFDGIYAMRRGMLANYFGSVLVALGHVGLVMLIAISGWLRALMSRFAAVGRMALSNYLLHSIVLTTVFYGYGLGYYGQVPRAWQMLFVLGVISLQLVLSPWWLRRFCFGPAEWAWRSLTYGRLQPMRSGAANPR